jgi:hypothetical protein
MDSGQVEEDELYGIMTILVIRSGTDEAAFI